MSHSCFYDKACETGPPAYSPYPKRLESLTIWWCNYKGSTIDSVILRPWLLVRPELKSQPPAWQPDAQPTEPSVHKSRKERKREFSWEYPVHYWEIKTKKLKRSTQRAGLEISISFLEPGVKCGLRLWFSFSTPRGISPFTLVKKRQALKEVKQRDTNVKECKATVLW